MKKITILTCAIIGAVGNIFGQMGARLDQFYMDHAAIIPAAITRSNEGYASLYYNKLFMDVPGAPQHTLFNSAMPLPKSNTAFGLMYMKENIAFSEMHNAYATYAYNIGITPNSKLALGVSVGVLSQNFDPSKAIFYDDNDAKITALMFSPPVVRADLRASAYFKTDRFFTGISVTRLPQPTFDYSYYNYAASYDLQSQANFIIGYDAPIDDNFTLKPAVHVGMFNWDYLYYQFNVSVDYDDVVWMGFGVNNIWQAGFNLGFAPQEDIKVSYSYTIPDGQQRGLLGPMHEFTTRIGFAALGAGKGKGGSGDDESDDDDDDDNGKGKKSKKGGDDEDEGDGEGQGNSPSERTKKDVIVKKIEDLEGFGFGNDTSGIQLPPIPKLKPEPGYYLVAGLHASEEKANLQIKSLYLKKVNAFKVYDPRNKSFYVFLKYFTNEKDANKGTFYFEGSVPNVWVREIR